MDRSSTVLCAVQKLACILAFAVALRAVFPRPLGRALRSIDFCKRRTEEVIAVDLGRPGSVSHEMARLIRERRLFTWSAPSRLPGLPLGCRMDPLFSSTLPFHRVPPSPS